MLKTVRDFALIPFTFNLLRFSTSIAILVILANGKPDFQLLFFVIVLGLLFTIWDFLTALKTMISSMRERERRHQRANAQELVPASTYLWMSFDSAFRKIGVSIEKYRGEIEKSTDFLRCPSQACDVQALAFCLKRLLDEAAKNWLDQMILSPREREILTLLAKDISYNQIGRALFLSQSTVKTHVYHIFQKMGTTNRKDTVRIACEKGWIPDYVPDDGGTGRGSGSAVEEKSSTIEDFCKTVR